MKARLPKGYGGGGTNNIQQLARQAQKIQDDMEAANAELEAKEYEAAAVMDLLVGVGDRLGKRVRFCF